MIPDLRDHILFQLRQRRIKLDYELRVEGKYADSQVE